MSKIAVVYWSGTGNTEAMAAPSPMARPPRGRRPPFSPPLNSPTPPDMTPLPSAAPPWAPEQLEEDEFEPMFSACKSALKGKKIALFGSYGWGDGEWMRNWEGDCRAAGAELACDSVICAGEPDAEALAACEALGKALA